ncbi:MAG: polyphosphate:AMP phosphotransferase [Rhodocyclaceae bacterium]
MFESAELGHTIDKAQYDRIVPRLRADLLDAQFDLGSLGRFPVLVLVNGVDGAGKGETVNILNAWMDPRHIHTHAFGEPSDEERDRPAMWRFWRALPPKGKIGILFGNWYTEPIVDRVSARCDDSQLAQRLEEINRFEDMLVQEGALIVKLWFHLSRQAQRTRLKALERDRATRWRVTSADWKHFELYESYRKVSELVLRHTSTGKAPWLVIEGADARYRYVTAGKVLLNAMRKRLEQEARGWHARVNAAPLPPAIDSRHLLNTLVLRQKLARKDYLVQIEREQGRLARLTRKAKFGRRALVVVFEGMDAAGKGGTIRRITGALDARQYTIVPIAAPTEEERAQPYLWRFWRHLPRRGRVTIFDRSWYGRVLVERVEGYCSEADWLRAYAEINDFEDQLVRHGIVLAKFWLAISQEEQLKRFQEREKTRFKRFKITAEDWRNRKKWPDYEHAVCDMVDRTSTEATPWTLVEADNKYHARIKVLKTLCGRIEEALG